MRRCLCRWRPAATHTKKITAAYRYEIAGCHLLRGWCPAIFRLSANWCFLYSGSARQGPSEHSMRASPRAAFLAALLFTSNWNGLEFANPNAAAKEPQAPTSSKPTVYVSDFEIDALPSESGNRMAAAPQAGAQAPEDDPRKQASRLVELMSTKLVAALRKAGYTAVRMHEGDARPDSGGFGEDASGGQRCEPGKTGSGAVRDCESARQRKQTWRGDHAKPVRTADEIRSQQGCERRRVPRSSSTHRQQLKYFAERQSLRDIAIGSRCRLRGSPVLWKARTQSIALAHPNSALSNRRRGVRPCPEGSRCGRRRSWCLSLAPSARSGRLSIRLAPTPNATLARCARWEPIRFAGQ